MRKKLKKLDKIDLSNDFLELDKGVFKRLELHRVQKEDLM